MEEPEEREDGSKDMSRGGKTQTGGTTGQKESMFPEHLDNVSAATCSPMLISTAIKIQE